MSDPVEKDERLGLPSASGMERLIACPGSWQLEQAARASGYKESSIYADKGTEIHEANETGDVSELEVSEVDLVKKVRATEERIFKQWCDDIGIKPEQATIRREHREWVFRHASPSASAKIDFSAISGQDSLVLDLKSGRKEVSSPAENWQLRTAAVALFQNYGVSNVRVGIVQPFAKKSPLCDYDSDAMEICAKSIFASIDESNRPGVRLVPGDHCEYCLARHGCFERKKADAALVAMRLSRWELIKPEEKAALWASAKQAEKFSKDIKKRIEDELDADPKSVPGLMRRPSGETRSITAPTAAIEAAKIMWGPFTGAQRDTFTDMSISGMEEVVTQIQGVTKDAAKQIVNTTLFQFIHREPRKGSVVSIKQID